MECKECHTKLTEYNFHESRRKKNYYLCNKCYRNYLKKYNENNKLKIREDNSNRYKENKHTLTQLKINGCAICGYDKHTEICHFHHINPKNKKFKIGTAAMYRKDFWDEFYKTILLCPNCHAVQHLKGDR